MIDVFFSFFFLFHKIITINKIVRWSHIEAIAFIVANGFGGRNEKQINNENIDTANSVRGAVILCISNSNKQSTSTEQKKRFLLWL